MDAPLHLSMSLALTYSSISSKPPISAEGWVSLGWVSSLCGSRANLVAWSGKGVASCVALEVVASFPSVAVKCVSMPRTSIKSRKFGPDSSSDDRSSGGGRTIFLILVMDAFCVGFIHVFSLGAIIQNSAREIKSEGVSQLPAKHWMAAAVGSHNVPRNFQRSAFNSKSEHPPMGKNGTFVVFLLSL